MKLEPERAASLATLARSHVGLTVVFAYSKYFHLDMLRQRCTNCTRPRSRVCICQMDLFVWTLLYPHVCLVLWALRCSLWPSVVYTSALRRKRDMKLRNVTRDNFPPDQGKKESLRSMDNISATDSNGIRLLIPVANFLTTGPQWVLKLDSGAWSRSRLMDCFGDVTIGRIKTYHVMCSLKK